MILSNGRTGCFPGASAGTKASSIGKGASGSRYRGRGTGKGEGKPDSRRPSLAKSRQTSSGPMRGCCVARCVMARQIFQITDHVTKITHISNALWQFFGFGARPVDNTDHQTWNTSCRGECGWRELFNFVFSGLDGLVSIVTVLLQLVSSSSCKSCVEELHNQNQKLSTSIDSTMRADH